MLLSQKAAGFLAATALIWGSDARTWCMVLPSVSFVLPGHLCLVAQGLNSFTHWPQMYVGQLQPEAHGGMLW